MSTQLETHKTIPDGVRLLITPVVWESDDLGQKAAKVIVGIVHQGRGLKEVAAEVGLTIREARDLVRQGWFGELVSQAVGSKLVVMSEFRSARLRERMEMIEERVEEAEAGARIGQKGSAESLLLWLEQARKEMEGGKGLESVMEMLGNRSSGPMIQVNIGRYDASAAHSRQTASDELADYSAVEEALT